MGNAASFIQLNQNDFEERKPKSNVWWKRARLSEETKMSKRERQQLLTIMASSTVSTASSMAANREKSMCASRRSSKETKMSGKQLVGFGGEVPVCRPYCGHNDRKRKYIKHIDCRLKHRERVSTSEKSVSSVWLPAGSLFVSSIFEFENLQNFSKIGNLKAAWSITLWMPRDSLRSLLLMPAN